VEVLPIHVSQTSLIRQVQQVTARQEGKLGDEQACYIDGCQRDWDRLSISEGPLTVGIDGGYVHARDGDREQGGLVRGHRRQEQSHRITMRLTVLQQLWKELGTAASDLHLDEIAADLDRIKMCGLK
jgi:hypothetical protein